MEVIGIASVIILVAMSFFILLIAFFDGKHSDGSIHPIHIIPISILIIFSFALGGKVYGENTTPSPKPTVEPQVENKETAHIQPTFDADSLKICLQAGGSWSKLPDNSTRCAFLKD